MSEAHHAWADVAYAIILNPAVGLMAGSSILFSAMAVVVSLWRWIEAE